MMATPRRRSDPVPSREFEVTLVGGPGKPDVRLPRFRKESELDRLEESAKKAGYGFRATHIEKV